VAPVQLFAAKKVLSQLPSNFGWNVLVVNELMQVVHRSFEIVSALVEINCSVEN
jgi:hypothetical protein